MSRHAKKRRRTPRRENPASRSSPRRAGAGEARPHLGGPRPGAAGPSAAGPRSSLLKLALLRMLVGLCRRDIHMLGVPMPDGYYVFQPVHKPLTEDDVREHLASRRLLAVDLMPAGGNETQVGVINLEYPYASAVSAAPHVIRVAKALSVNLFPVANWHGGGVQLWARWNAPQRARDVRAHLRKILVHTDWILTHAHRTTGLDDMVVCAIGPARDDAPADGYTGPEILPFFRRSEALDAAMRPLPEPPPWVDSAPVPPAPDWALEAAFDPAPEPSPPPFFDMTLGIAGTDDPFEW
jgi:hypothetical protein